MCVWSTGHVTPTHEAQTVNIEAQTFFLQSLFGGDIFGHQNRLGSEKEKEKKRIEVSTKLADNDDSPRCCICCDHPSATV